MKPAESTLTTPFFVSTSEDASRLSVLTNQLNAKALSCSEAASCDQVHYGRGLVSLFENREAARGWFRRVIEQNPASPLAVTSQMWLRLIEKDEQAVGSTQREASAVSQIAVEFVREWIDHQWLERTTAEKTLTPARTHEESFDQSRLLLRTQRQLREREQQISALRSQLEALKSIDQEEKQRKIKPPASLRATEHQWER
jgi:hypothetical protein